MVAVISVSAFPNLRGRAGKRDLPAGAIDRRMYPVLPTRRYPSLGSLSKLQTLSERFCFIRLLLFAYKLHAGGTFFKLKQ